MPGVSSAYREFVNTKGNKLTARVIKKDALTVTLERKKDKKQFKLKLVALSLPDQAYVRDWEFSDLEEEPEEKLIEEEAPTKGSISKFYPRTKNEIRDGLAEIKKRKTPQGVSKDAFEATKRLNSYRFLSGLAYEVESDPELNENAKKAAVACKNNGGLSHSLGEFTDKCNLALGGGLADTVRMYMDDRGANNREKRGHRRWCLNPPMGKTGFGSEGSYAAMWAMDSSGGRSRKKFWSYPGEGYYPLEYLNGNSWSVYFDQAVPSVDEVEIRVVKFSRRPDRLPVDLDESSAREIPVIYQFSFLNTLNFEVEYPRRKKGIYWVQIKGRGINHSYLVELY